LELLETIHPGYQPKGITLDEANQLAYIANRNADPTGADAPHHYTECEDNNGYITLLDLNTLTMVEGRKTEVSVAPYSIVLQKRSR